MPITSLGSYLPTIQEFLNHWTQVNAELGATAPLLLQGGYTLANFTADRDALQTVTIALEGADNTRTNTATDRDIRKNALRVRLTQFRAMVQGQLFGSIYVRSVPRMPLFSASESAYLKAFDDMANLWSQINAVPPAGFAAPLLLPGAYSQANLQTDITALRAVYAAANNAVQNARIARQRRSLLLPALRNRLQQYRKVAVGRLSPNSPLVGTLPAYSPPPGATPAPVSVSGVWNAVLRRAEITWTASDNPNVASYSLRTAPPPTYRVDDETALGSVPPTQTVFRTDAGLSVPGSVALFRVYVVLSTGNERGSATVRIVRPPDGG